jgi:hypothetical protein
MGRSVTATLAESEWVLLEAMAAASGKRVSSLAGEMIRKALDKGPTNDDAKVLGEVKKLGRAITELMTEFMLYVTGGDSVQAFAKVNEMLDRVRGQRVNGGE